MVDNFMSAGTNGDADDELPAPYGTGPKNRTTEDQHRSDYGYADRSGDGGWRERSTALDGLDPAPSLPNAPRSYERGPVPQQPYVPKPPFLTDPDYTAASGGYPVTDPSTYGDSSPWGGPETRQERGTQQESGGYEESPFAPRPQYQDRPSQDRASQDRAPDRAAQDRAAQDRAVQERAAQERAAQERATQERAAQERAAQERAAQERASQERASQERAAQERAGQERAAAQERQASERQALERQALERQALERQALERQQQERYQERGYAEQPPFRQPPPGQPQQAQQNPFGPGRNGTSGPPPSRPGPGTPAGPGPGGPPPPRPGGPGPTGNGVTPHTSNGAPANNGWTQAGPESRPTNGLSAPTPPPGPAGPPGSNGLRSSNGLGSSGSNSVAASNTTPGGPLQNGPAAPSGPGNPSAPGNASTTGSQAGPANRQGPGGQGPTGWTGTAPSPASPPPASASSSANGYPSDPSAEYESNTPLSAAPPSNTSTQESSQRPAGARRRADVQQDAPSQVQQDAPISSHRAARRAQASPVKAETSAETTAPKAVSIGGPSSVSNSISGDGGGSAVGSPGGSSTSSDAAKRPRRYRIHHLRDMKNRGEKWAMLTAYDQYTAEIFDQAGIPVLLVGDSAANNVFGYESTLRVTVDELIPLARAVAGAVDRALVVADLPFGSYQASPEQAFHTAVRFMKEAGVHAVKLEGGRTVVPAVEKLTQSGIPVMAHIGFTPQSEHTIGGYRVQGRGDQAAALIDDAVALAEAGAFSVVLEMVPGDVSAEITKRISIPTIGIGAGRDTDAQVLVWQDMAGMRSGQMPRFVKQYADLRGILTNAAATFAAEVGSGTFPTDDHTF